MALTAPLDHTTSDLLRPKPFLRKAAEKRELGDKCVHKRNKFLISSCRAGSHVLLMFVFQSWLSEQRIAPYIYNDVKEIDLFTPQQEAFLRNE